MLLTVSPMQFARDPRPGANPCGILAGLALWLGPLQGQSRLTLGLQHARRP